MSNKAFDYKNKLKLTVSNGVRAFTYDVTHIDYEGERISGVDLEGKEYSFGFALVDAMGEVYTEDVEPNAPPVDDDKPIDLSEIPF